MAFSDLNYRPKEEDIRREAERVRIEVLSKMSNIHTDNVAPDTRIPDDVSAMDNDQRNDYIIDYNYGKIEPTLANTSRMVEVLLVQTEDVQYRAKTVKEFLKDRMSPISTEHAPAALADDMRLLYGKDVDTTQLTPEQLLCASNAINLQAKFIEKNQEDAQTEIVDNVITNEKSPLHVPGVPQDTKEFEDMIKKTFDDENLFDWNILTFLIMLLKVVLETVIMFIFKPICKIKIIGIKVGKMLAEGVNVTWNEIEVGKKKDGTPIKRWKAKGTIVGPLSLLGMVINKDVRCCIDEPCTEIDLDLYWKNRMLDISTYIKQGGYVSAEELASDFSGNEDAPLPKDLDKIPLCSAGGDRMPTQFEINAANNIINYATQEAKRNDRNEGFKDFFGMMATASVEEECVVMSATCGNMHDKLAMIRISGDGAANLISTQDTKFGRINKQLDSTVTKYTQTLSETLRNLDMTVSAALELAFLPERWKDTICCFVRLLYALFVGKDDFKLASSWEDDSAKLQEKSTDWQRQYEKHGKVVADKVKLLAEVADTLLSTFTTTVSTNFEVKLGNFSLAQFGQFIISTIRKSAFEALVTVNEYLFGSIRKLVFGAIAAIINESKELKIAMEECVLFSLIVNWLQCLLNFLQNKVLQLLQKIRGEGDVAWGQIEINLDFAFQNRQIGFLSDLLKIIANWAFQIVSICNIDNIKDNDAFIDLIKDITKDVGLEPYNPYDVRDEEKEYFSYGIPSTMVNSIMRPEDDHSRIVDSNTRNFLRTHKGEFGLSYKNNVVVDQGGKSSDNISPTTQDSESQQDSSRGKVLASEAQSVTVPPTLAIPKDEFVTKCTKTYTNIGGILRNDKKLRDLFNKYDIYDEFSF